jgi:hypothetical protein
LAAASSCRRCAATSTGSLSTCTQHNQWHTLLSWGVCAYVCHMHHVDGLLVKCLLQVEVAVELLPVTQLLRSTDVFLWTPTLWAPILSTPNQTCTKASNQQRSRSYAARINCCKHGSSHNSSLQHQ